MIAIEGRIAAVTGAARGIGLAIARQMRAAGADVIMLDRDGPALTTAAEALGAIAAVTADCSDPAAAAAVLSDVAADAGGLDVLVNNAGRFAATDNDATPLAAWDETLRVNLIAPHSLSLAAARHMRRRGGGAIVNVSSVAAYYPRAEQAAYCASKAGLEHLTRVLALGLAPDNIRVNTLRPGLTESSMGRQAVGGGDGHVDGIPLRRMARPEAVAEAALFLATAEHVTGQVLCVDGGQTINFVRPLPIGDGPSVVRDL